MFGRSPVHYEVSGTTQVMGHGGIGLIHRQVTRLGLAAQIDQRLHLLKRHLPYHESDHVLNLAYSILCGGTRLEDVERLQGDLACMEALGAALIPDPTTASDFCRRFKADEAMALQEAINAVRPTLWRGRGRGLLGPVAYLDYVLAAYMWCGQPGRVCA